MASAIPPPHVPFAPGSSSLLDVLRSGAPCPFFSSPASSIPVFVLVFCCITFLYVFVFFAVSADLLLIGFTALRPLLGFFHAPTTTSFHHTLLCTGSTYTRSISFCLYSVMLLFFSLYFVCYLLVIMLWPQWFDWIPFDLDLCVVDVNITLAFGSRMKNGPEFCVMDKCVSWLNCRG
jgi:hypothetical protein